MPHPKQKRSSTHLPGELLMGQSTLTDSASEGPTHAELDGSTVQPTAPHVGVVHKTQPQHQQATQSVQRKSLSAHPGSKALPVLPWMRVPISIEGGMGVPLQQVVGLHPLALAALQTGKYTELFPVQAAAWRVLAGGLSKAHDLCIAAPTGSGKTLAYTLPVLHCLIGRVHSGLGALIVLPTQDLATQVYKVFAQLCPAVGLRLGLANGKLPLALEAEVLVDQSADEPCCAVDVLVATPGRLMSHLQGTPGIHLDALKMLVVDETDRMLRQSYQDWLPYLTAALAAQQRPLHHRVVKVVVSATLTRDPSKVERLGLHCPRYIAMTSQDHRYKLPKELSEYKLVCAAVQKPLFLLAVLHSLKGQSTIVFTASLEATHRVFLFLDACKSNLAEGVVEYSSHVSSVQRTANLGAFCQGECKVLVASDAMTRGMDIPSVANIVNYDAPVHTITYLHRVGRTARAGQPGCAITLLRHEDVRHFKNMLRKVDNAYVKDFTITSDVLNELKEPCQHALDATHEKLLDDL
ncbi:hypothetical protein ABBQ32_005296 [Trebouxia sp. C0010 RCD-2024]